MPNDDQLLRETYRLAKENNRMLHAMRRDAFLGKLFKLLLYVAVAGIFLWSYLTFIAPVLQQMLHTLSQIQAAGNQAQTQMTDWQKTLQDLQNKIRGLSSTSAH